MESGLVLRWTMNAYTTSCWFRRNIPNDATAILEW